MTDENGLTRLQKLRVKRGDVVIVTLKDAVPDAKVKQIGDSLHEFAKDSGARVLVFRERALSDFRVLGLSGLLKVRADVEEAIRDMVQRDSIGEA